MSRLIFGSCSSQHYQEQPLWPVIQKRNATAFVWGGDAVYADDRAVWKGLRRKRIDASPDYLHKLYQNQRNEPGYKALLETNISIFGTIDDHDYGTNNGDRTFEWKRENIIEFVRFLGLDEESIIFRRATQGHGIYGVQVYDFDRPPMARLLSDDEAGLDPDVVATEKNPTGTLLENKLVAVYVLDIRSHRTPWSESDGDFLGEVQWKWFETAIRRSHAAVNVIVTGLQVHPERFFPAHLVENWSGFRRSQHRLYQALLQPNVRAPILISGDVHHAQLMRKDCRRNQKHQQHHHQQSLDSQTQTATTTTTAIRPIYEITTSGMTHSWGTKVCGQAKSSPLCHSRYHNFLFGHLLHLAHVISPWTEILLDTSTGTDAGTNHDRLQYSLAINVAELEFDWDRHSVSVTIWGVNDQRLLQQEWPMKDLTKVDDTLVPWMDFDGAEHRLRTLTIMDSDDENSSNDWVCVHYRGIPDPILLAVGAGLPFCLVLVLGSLPLWIGLFLCYFSISRFRMRVIRASAGVEPKKKTQ